MTEIRIVVMLLRLAFQTEQVSNKSLNLKVWKKT